uniref:(northern house mosquito) hypothetical protein n=1 Tax=Culex pipiens TaxID=7175 RepID=A0A8D8FA92_CULPI
MTFNSIVGGSFVGLLHLQTFVYVRTHTRFSTAAFLARKQYVQKLCCTLYLAFLSFLLDSLLTKLKYLYLYNSTEIHVYGAWCGCGCVCVHLRLKCGNKS